MLGKDFIVSQDLDQTASGSDLSWRTIDSAPVDEKTRFLAFQNGEVWQAYGKINPTTGASYFVRRTHERQHSWSYTTMPIEWRGEVADRKVILTEEPDDYAFHWVSWSRGFDFKPTHWMPLPPLPSSPNEPPEDKSRATDKLTITHELGPDGEVRLVERRDG